MVGGGGARRRCFTGSPDVLLAVDEETEREVGDGGGCDSTSASSAFSGDVSTAPVAGSGSGCEPTTRITGAGGGTGTGGSLSIDLRFLSLDLRFCLQLPSSALSSSMRRCLL